MVIAGLAAVECRADDPPAKDTTAVTGVHAETGLDSTSGVDDYVAYAIAKNPFLRAYADMHTAALEVPDQVGALPDPMFSVGYFVSSPETRVGPQELTLRLAQKLPFFGKRSLKGDIAQKDADVWGRTYDEKFLDLVRDVKHAYYDYFRVYQVTLITQREKDVVREMQNVAQVKYASGLASQQDVLKAQLALSNLDDRLTTLRRDLVTVTARLNDLLNRGPDAPLALPRVGSHELDSPPIDELYGQALSKRPDLAVVDLNMAKAEKSRALAKREYYPDLTLSVNYITVGDRPVPVEDNGKDIWHIGASLNLPIWYGKLGSAVKESEARMAVARSQRQGLQTRIKNEVQDAYSRVESAGELVRLHRDVIIPQAEQTFRASEAGYQTGKVDFLNYLDSQRMLLSVRQTYYSLVADLGKRQADLDRTLGAGWETTSQQHSSNNEEGDSHD
jgi:outer membrane protein TolC